MEGSESHIVSAIPVQEIDEVEKEKIRIQAERDVEMRLAQGDGMQIAGEGGGNDDSQQQEKKKKMLYILMAVVATVILSRGGRSCGHCWWLGGSASSRTQPDPSHQHICSI
jgi:hypothetical protein